MNLSTGQAIKVLIAGEAVSPLAAIVHTLLPAIDTGNLDPYVGPVVCDITVVQHDAAWWAWPAP
jgi:hypothetical protein